MKVFWWKRRQRRVEEADFKEKREIYKDQEDLSSKFFQDKSLGCMRQRDKFRGQWYHIALGPHAAC